MEAEEDLALRNKQEEEAVTIAGNIPPQKTFAGHTFNEDLFGPGPFLFDGCDTLVKLFRQKCLERGDKVAHREKDYGKWFAYSWSDFYEHARLIGLGLISLGLERGAVVSILSEDNKEWMACGGKSAGNRNKLVEGAAGILRAAPP